MKGRPRTRSILHVDLDPFFVSVERAREPGLRGRPLIVGGSGSGGMVAAASDEARAEGVRPGQALAEARRLCPEGIVKPGDLEAYAQVSEEVTAILLAVSRRVERPSADEAYVDLTPEAPGVQAAVPGAEAIKEQIQRRLGLDASLGLASTRLAARVASRWARPRGLLVVLPGYEASFLRRQPLSWLPDLPPHLETALDRAGFASLGDVLDADPAALAAVVGTVAATRLQAAVRCDDESPIQVAAPPSSVQEEATIRSRSSDRSALQDALDALAGRAWRRIRPFGLGAGTLSVEVRRTEAVSRRSEAFERGLDDEVAIRETVHRLADSLLDPAAAVRGLHLRLGRLAPPSPQAPLFPGWAGPALRRSSSSR